MKCEIIRDLLPSYVDGLTSEESNREITAHVAECAPCKEILSNAGGGAGEGTEGKTENQPVSEIQPQNDECGRGCGCGLHWRGRLWIQGVCEGFAINPQEITMEPKLEGDMLYLNFSVEKGGLTNVGSFMIPRLHRFR